MTHDRTTALRELKNGATLEVTYAKSCAMLRARLLHAGGNDQDSTPISVDLAYSLFASDRLHNFAQRRGGRVQLWRYNERHCR